MNLSSLFQSMVAMAKPFVAMYGEQSHSVVERWCTIPAKDRAKLLTGLEPDEKVEAERLMKVAADANSDAVVYIASRGAIEAD